MLMYISESTSSSTYYNLVFKLYSVMLCYVGYVVLCY